MIPDKVYRFKGKALGQRGTIRLFFNQLVIPQQRQRAHGVFHPLPKIIHRLQAHIIAIGNAKIMVKSETKRREFRLIAQMSLPDHLRRISRILKNIRNRLFLRI